MRQNHSSILLSNHFLSAVIQTFSFFSCQNFISDFRQTIPQPFGNNTTPRKLALNILNTKTLTCRGRHCCLCSRLSRCSCRCCCSCRCSRSCSCLYYQFAVTPREQWRTLAKVVCSISIPKTRAVILAEIGGAWHICSKGRLMGTFSGVCQLKGRYNIGNIDKTTSTSMLFLQPTCESCSFKQWHHFDPC